jgi:hypothetical protein
MHYPSLNWKSYFSSSYKKVSKNTLLLSFNSYYDRPVCDAVYYISYFQFHSKESAESFFRTNIEAAGFF